MPEVLRETWAVVAAWIGVFVSITVAVRNMYAAERDRQALEHSKIEREKLELEILRLQKDPAVVAERREIYERLRTVVGEITAKADATVDQIRRLHSICHDATFRFPQEIPEAIQDFISNVAVLRGTNIDAEGKRGTAGRDEWSKLTERNFEALEGVRLFEEGLTEMFRPHLSL